MTALRKQVAALFVDQSCQQRIVRDPEGPFPDASVCGQFTGTPPTILPATEETELEPVPGALQGHARTTILKAVHFVTAEHIRLGEAR